jgi:nucleotide-binding universal stress UspA family protein
VILLCYDGSPNSKDAVARAADLFARQPATVLTVWEGLGEVLARTGSDLTVSATEVDEVDNGSEQNARAQAEEGADLARAGGLSAQARIRRRDTSNWEAILDEADALGADAIVLGTRGLTGIKSLVLGSVSGAVLHHSDRPVLIVPPADVAARRAAHRRH